MISRIVSLLGGSAGSYILIAIAVAFALLLGALSVQTVRLADARAETSDARFACEKERTAAAEAGAAAEQRARAAEHDLATYMAAADKRLQEGIANAQKNADQTIADLRAGTLRLRRQFAGQSCPGGVPGAAAGTGGGDATAAGGLREQDAGFLVRESQRADAVVLQLSECQRILANERESQHD